MRPALYCLHGWGFDASFFDPLAAALPEWDFVREDLGFFGAAEPEAGGTPAEIVSPARHGAGFRSIEAPEARPLVLVGHSMGLALLVGREELVASASAVVSLCGFPRFCRAPDFKAGVAPRLVKRMLERFNEAPVEVLRDFRARCGLDEPGVARDAAEGAHGSHPAERNVLEGMSPQRLAEPGVLESMNGSRLAEALAGLLDIDVRDALSGLDKPLLVLGAEDDLISPPALSVESFAPFGPAMAAVSPDGGHVLPLTRPDWCAERLREFLAGLDGFSAR